MYKQSIIIALAAIVTPALAFAEVEDYIQTMCEQNGGKWNDKNMACNDFDSEIEQDNFADALIEREEYDRLVSYCEDHDGEWNDKEIACDIKDKKERTYFEDSICDDGSHEACEISQRGIDNDDCYYEGKKVNKGDEMYWVCD